MPMNSIWRKWNEWKEEEDQERNSLMYWKSEEDIASGMRKLKGEKDGNNSLLIEYEE